MRALNPLNIRGQIGLAALAGIYSAAAVQYAVSGELLWLLWFGGSVAVFVLTRHQLWGLLRGHRQVSARAGFFTNTLGRILALMFIATVSLVWLVLLLIGGKKPASTIPHPTSDDWSAWRYSDPRGNNVQKDHLPPSEFFSGAWDWDD